MTGEEQTLLMIRGAIASLPEKEQAAVSAAVAAVRDVLKQHEEGAAIMALAQLGAELAAKP